MANMYNKIKGNNSHDDISKLPGHHSFSPNLKDHIMAFVSQIHRPFVCQPKTQLTSHLNNTYLLDAAQQEHKVAFQLACTGP